MAKLERTYNVPLRRGVQKAPRYKRAKKAVTILKKFLMQHMKCQLEQLKIGKMLNLKLWEHGVKNPPHHVKVTVIKDDEGVVKAELFGFKYIEPVKEEKKEEKKEKPAEEKKAEAEKTEVKHETKKEEKKEKSAQEKKTEVKQEAKKEEKKEKVTKKAEKKAKEPAKHKKAASAKHKPKTVKKSKK